jgi:hypothetical protein
MLRGRRKTRRLRIRWMEGIKDAMPKRGVDKGQWMDIEEWHLGI